MLDVRGIATLPHHHNHQGPNIGNVYDTGAELESDLGQQPFTPMPRLPLQIDHFIHGGPLMMRVKQQGTDERWPGCLGIILLFIIDFGQRRKTKWTHHSRPEIPRGSVSPLRWDW